MKNKKRVVINLIVILLVVIQAGINIIFFSNITNFMFDAFNRDYVDAARRVKTEENKIIENKIREIKNQSLKRILNPVVAQD